MDLTFSRQQPRRLHPQVVQVLDDFLDPRAVASAYDHFKAFRTIASSGEFWFDVQSFRASDDDLPRSTGLLDYFDDYAGFIAGHIKKLLNILPAESMQDAKAIELWFRSDGKVSTADKVYLHTDSNHPTENWTSNVRLPMWGSVLHLGPSGGLIGGETSFCTEDPIPPAMVNQLHEYVPREAARALSREWIDVGQRQNRLIVFLGRLPHYAAPIRALNAQNEPRISMLVNIWDHLPIAKSKLNGCCTMLPPEFRAICKLSENQLELLETVVHQLSPNEVREAIQFMTRAAGPAATG